MVKSIKKVFLGLISLVMVTSIALFVGFANNGVNANAQGHLNTTTDTITMVEGAFLRLTDIDDEYKGIRFVGVVNQEYFESLGDGATVGMAIKKGDSTELIEIGDSGVYNSVADCLYDQQGGMNYFTTVIYNIPNNESGVKITARAYVKAVDGEYKYSSTQQIRSMAYVADKAMHGAYSSYSDILLPYVDSAITSFGLEESEVNLFLDSDTENEYTLTPVIESAENSLTVTYSSEDTGICEVDENGVITAIAYGETTVTATCGSKTASVSVKVSLNADRSMISNAEIETVNNLLNANYTVDENKLPEGSEVGINVTFDAQQLTSLSKDVVLKTEIDLVANISYDFYYEVKVNDSKWGGLANGFGYRVIINLLDESGKYISAEGYTNPDSLNLIAMNTTYTGNTNKEYYSCFMRCTPTTDLQNVKLAIRIAASNYTENVDFTLYKFKCYESSTGKFLSNYNENTQGLKTEIIDDATLLAGLSVDAGIHIYNEKSSTHDGLRGLLYSFPVSLKANTEYKVYFDVKDLNKTLNTASGFGFYVNAGNTAITQYTFGRPTGGKYIVATDTSVSGSTIYHSVHTITATEDLDELVMRVIPYCPTTAQNISFIVANVVVVESSEFAISAYETYGAGFMGAFATQDQDKLINGANIGFECLSTYNSWISLGTNVSLTAGTYKLKYQVIVLSGEENPVDISLNTAKYTSSNFSKNSSTNIYSCTVNIANENTSIDVTPTGSTYKVFDCEAEFTLTAQKTMYLGMCKSINGVGFIVTNLTFVPVTTA